jgi:hypothetical protein
MRSAGAQERQQQGINVWGRARADREWVNCACPDDYSFYQLIARFWAGGPSEAEGATIHRVCTLARKMRVQSLVIEDALGRADVVDEVEHLEAWAEIDTGDVSAVAFTFLWSPRAEGGDTTQIRPDDIIGQMTVVTFPMENARRSYIYEAILRPPRLGPEEPELLNNNLPFRSQLPLTIGGETHAVEATYFCQQNGVTSICAHSAVRCLVRTMTDETVTVGQLNEMWGHRADRRKVNTVKVQEALRKFGLRSISYKLEAPRDEEQNSNEAQKREYGPMEEIPLEDGGWGLLALLADSGMASLLVMSEDNADHVMPVLGHTINSDEWHPLGAVLHKNGQQSASSSSLWTDHLVIHDDVLGPYYCLSRGTILPTENPKLRTRLALALLPEGIHVSPLQAEDFARKILRRVIEELTARGIGKGPWWDHLVGDRERIVFRTTLISKEDYLATLKPQDASDESWKARLADALPDRFWMEEVSVANLFCANRAKLGEILISPTRLPTANDPDSVLDPLLGFRLPGALGWTRDGAPGPGRPLVMRPWPEDGHQPIHAPHHNAYRW